MSVTFTLAEVRSMAHGIINDHALTAQVLNIIRDVYYKYNKCVLITDTEFDKTHTVELHESVIESVYQNWCTNHSEINDLDVYM